MDYSLPDSSVILQARILEWVANPSSRGSSQPRDQTRVSRITGRVFTICKAGWRLHNVYRSDILWNSLQLVNAQYMLASLKKEQVLIPWLTYISLDSYFFLWWWRLVRNMVKISFTGFPGASDGKDSACNAGNSGLIPGLGRSPGEGIGYPLQYSCLENHRGVWQAVVHGVAKSRAWLSD